MARIQPYKYAIAPHGGAIGRASLHILPMVEGLKKSH